MKALVYTNHETLTYKKEKNIVKIINLILDNYTAYRLSIKLKIICHYFYLTGMLQYLKTCNRI